LLELLAKNPERTVADWITDELLRRHLGAISDETKKLVIATRDVERGVERLATSSNTLETLTRRLNRLTWALIVLTLLAVVTPLGIEVWKAHHEPQAAPASTPPKPSP
jgi:hypothetical protein